MKKEIADRIENICYQANGITYVPHFRNKNIFVGPGYPRFTLKTYSHNELAEAGAYKLVKMLWNRGEFGFVNKRNP